MSKSQVFFGGVPTDPDIQALRARWPESGLSVGMVIPFDEIEALLRMRRSDCRFKTVTNRWRKVIENGTGTIILGSERGIGFRVLSNSQKLDLGNQKFASAVKSSRRAFEITGRVDVKTATDEEKDRASFLQRRAAAVLGVSQIRSTSSELPALSDGAKS